MRHAHLDDLDLRCGRAPVFPGLRFATPWSRLDCLELAPGASGAFPADHPCEQGYVVLAGQLELRAGSPRNPPSFSGRHTPGRGVLIGPAGYAHELVNLADHPARLLHVRVEMETLPADCSVRVDDLDPQALRWRDAIHGGAGRIATRHLWGPADFASSWTFLDHALLAPNSSVGYHYHDALEECFVILAGQGCMTIADRTFAVAPNSATFQAIGEGHGLYNPGPGELEFLRFAVALPHEQYTTVDLHDDLSARHPS